MTWRGIWTDWGLWLKQMVPEFFPIPAGHHAQGWHRWRSFLAPPRLCFPCQSAIVFWGWDCGSFHSHFPAFPAFLSKWKRSQGGQRVQQTRAGEEGPEVSCACLGQPSCKGLAGRRPGHSLLTKESRAPIQTSWLHLGQGIRNLGTALGFLSANQVWLEAGIKPRAQECGSFPLPSPSWHQIPTQDSAYIMQLMKAK